MTHHYTLLLNFYIIAANKVNNITQPLSDTTLSVNKVYNIIQPSSDSNS